MNTEDQVKIVPFVPLALYADGEGDEYASMTVSIRMGYPRLTVYTDNNRKTKIPFSHDHLIIAPMDGIVVNMFIDMLSKIIKSDKEQKSAIKCFNVKYVDNKKTDEVILQATIIMGRDKDGVVYLGAVAEGKKKVKFKLLPRSKWHKFVNEQGEEVTDKRTLSTMFAMAYANRFKVLMDKYLADEINVKYTDRATTNHTISNEDELKDLFNGD